MTRKDYEALASNIRHAHQFVGNVAITKGKQEIARATMSVFVENVTQYLAADNPRFNRDKFLEACGL